MSGNRVHIDRQSSRLDLIDNTTLTSLPFPPPLKSQPSKLSKRSKPDLLANRSRSSPSILDNKALPLELKAARDVTSPLNKDVSARDASFTSIDTLTSQNMTTEIDDSFEDAEEPIIFVEDYMKPQQIPNSQPNFSRQKSLANFKKRLGGELKKRRISAEHEDLEQIFGHIPGKNLLKYCDICDKPLYEMSSLINNKRIKHNKINEWNDVFNEFICFECIDVYEDFLNELYTQEVEREPQTTSSSSMTESKNLKLLNIFKTIQLRSLDKRTIFSNNLISRLQFLNSKSLSTDIGELQELNWITTLQNKLRWRWRLDGLLPSFKRKTSN
ncbi:hypothetical protein PSN45_003169 [Yamadazyma tenuis]|uniref:Uncharacterized protein n=1 Tax=Candida tenuis (strain ATCC 10573 / BCRC 21748 / CBS 615 / JCM 9827 / NBRC 10315 / NRRL Y-1498 / VKM Y-70) TaxID=590646 RepID=G3AZ59_CANTC|nr:uncharacterized protein CANTEDRAFT_92365 [Yamadazyma tenuis ATCC 10573]EGV66014.1 hypothetical protein CANTEDRAFT_92365 [Yamadazyma tenuis ATCC 10573]WEJ95645.1 hypothetical protein PSN45_003169 [Yamadazyma tenuis]